MNQVRGRLMVTNLPAMEHIDLEIEVAHVVPEDRRIEPAMILVVRENKIVLEVPETMPCARMRTKYESVHKAKPLLGCREHVHVPKLSVNAVQDHAG